MGSHGNSGIQVSFVIVVIINDALQSLGYISQSKAFAAPTLSFQANNRRVDALV
jgi:hypothetical protein